MSLDKHRDPRPAPGTEGEGPEPGLGGRAGALQWRGGQEPPHLLHHWLLRCGRLAMDEGRGCAADREGHGWDAGWHYQWDRAEAETGTQGWWPGPWWGTTNSQEWEGRDWDRIAVGGQGAWERWGLRLGALGQALTQGSQAGASGTARLGLPADLRLVTARRLASLCSWAEVSDSWLVSGSAGASTTSGASWHSF